MDSIRRRATIGNAQVICVFACAVALTAIQLLCAQETTVDTAAHSFFEYEPTDLEPLFAASQATYVNSSVPQPYKTGTEVLPDGLLYRSYIAAPIRGLQEAQGDYVVVMDADLSHPPMTVPELLTPLESGTADFVIGSRYVIGGTVDESWSLFRHLNSRIAGWLAFGLTRAKDPMAGFFAIRRETLGDLSNLNPCGYKIGLEVMVRCGCKRVAEVPIHFEDRQYGESKLNLKEQWLYIQHLCRLYAFRYPELLRFAMFGAVGVSGMIVDLATFRGLMPVMGLAAGRAVAIWIAMTWNFLLNRRLTFIEPSGSHPLSEYFRFCTACMVGAGLS